MEADGETDQTAGIEKEGNWMMPHLNAITVAFRFFSRS